MKKIVLFSPENMSFLFGLVFSISLWSLYKVIFDKRLLLFNTTTALLMIMFSLKIGKNSVNLLSNNDKKFLPKIFSYTIKTTCMLGVGAFIGFVISYLFIILMNFVSPLLFKYSYITKWLTDSWVLEETVRSFRIISWENHLEKALLINVPILFIFVWLSALKPNILAFIPNTRDLINAFIKVVGSIFLGIITSRLCLGLLWNVLNLFIPNLVPIDYGFAVALVTIIGFTVGIIFSINNNIKYKKIGYWGDMNESPKSSPFSSTKII